MSEKATTPLHGADRWRGCPCHGFPKLPAAWQKDKEYGRGDKALALVSGTSATCLWQHEARHAELVRPDALG